MSKPPLHFEYMIRPDLDSLPTYVPGIRHEGALKLSSNEVTQPPLPAAVQAMSEAAASLNRYPDITSSELIDALAQHLGLTPEQVAVGNGSSALCQQLVQISCAEGDEVIFPWRSFEAYPIFTQVAGATSVAVPLLADGHHDLSTMAERISERTRLIFCCVPNNPSGTTISSEEFAHFMASVPEDVIVALDEAYFEYNRDPHSVVATEAIKRWPNVIGLRTFSKAYGLAGIRAGYAFGAPKIMSALKKVAIPFSVSSVAQAGAVASLKASDELLARTEETVAVRDEVAEAVGAAYSQGNFVWLPGAPAELAEALAKEKVLVRSFPEGIRITVTTQAEASRLIEAFRRIS